MANPVTWGKGYCKKYKKLIDYKKRFFQQFKCLVGGMTHPTICLELRITFIFLLFDTGL